MNIRYSTLILTIALLATWTLSAQPTRIPEYEIKQQAKFLEAHKLKMIDKFDKAIELYLEVYDEDRENHTAAYELARLYLREDKKDLSEKYIKKAIEVEPNNQWYRLFYAKYLEKEGYYGKSAQQYKKVTELNPDDYESFENWAMNETKNANFTEAIRIYNVLEGKYGITERTVRKKFELYKNDNDSKNALLELQRISDAHPNNINYLNNLAGYYKELGKDSDAERVYKKVLDIDPQNPYALVAMSKKSDITQDTPAYLATLKTIIQNPQIDIDHKVKELVPYVTKAGSNEQEDQILLSLMTEMKNAHPDDAKAHAIFGDLNMNLKKYDVAVKSYKKTLDLNRKVYDVWQQLMYAQQYEQEYDDLLKTSSRALVYFPNQGRSYFFNGLAMHYKGQYQLSTDAATEALYIGSRDMSLQQDCHLLIGKNAIQTKDYKAAKVAIDKGIEIGANHPGLQEIAGDISMHQGNAEEALKYWEKAIQVGGNKERISKKIAAKQIN